MKSIALALILSLSCGSVFAQTTQKLTATKLNEYGLIYSLPNTVVDVTIEVETTVEQPGQFYNYAKKYLNIDNAITSASRVSTVKSITLTPRGVTNPEEKYLVQFKAGSVPYIVVNDQNTPLSVNTEETLAINAPTLPVATPAQPTALETDAARQAITQEMIQSSSTAKRAELTATRIYELREARNEIISGQSDQSFPDGKALQLALDNLTAQENALTAMFVGTTQKSTTVKTITFTPDKEEITDKVFARVSPIDGIIDASNLAGDPIYISYKIVEQGELPQNEKGLTKTFPKGGLAYNIPGKAEIKINYDGEDIADQTFEIAQLGVTFGIEPALFTDKKAPAYVIFDPRTGAISRIATIDQ